MHINVRDFLAESVGYNRDFQISGERPPMEAVVLTHDIHGSVTISRLETASVLVEGHLTTEIQLECHRCLRSFTHPVRISFRQMYAQAPKDDELPIVSDEIDLAPLIEQEIILSLPIKILDRPDCPGLGPEAAKFTEDDSGTSLKDRAHITKGTHTRGRT